MVYIYGWGAQWVINGKQEELNVPGAPMVRVAHWAQTKNKPKPSSMMGNN